MNFAFSPEQEDLRREARAFLEANPTASIEQLRELGWVGILGRGDTAGDDLTFVDAAVLFEELGRALYEGPYVVNEVASQPGDEVWSIEIDGFVPHLEQVDRVLTPDMQGQKAEGTAVATVDASLGLGELQRNGSEPAQGQWDAVRQRLLAALALEAVGIGQKALELSVDYVKEREQFGRPIGAYQAVAHEVTNMYVDVELARSLAYWAAVSVADGHDDVAVACASAKSFAGEAAVRACERSIQVHGGTGFTWEHPLHRYYKRALWLEGAFGYGREQRAEVAEFLLRS